MPQFSYKARRRSGQLVEGVLEVADRSAALVQIERLGLFPVAIDAAKGGAAVAVERPGKGKTDWRALLPPSVQAAMAKKANGRSTVPQIFIGGVSVGGCDDLHAGEFPGPPRGRHRLLRARLEADAHVGRGVLHDDPGDRLPRGRVDRLPGFLRRVEEALLVGVADDQFHLL